MKIILLLFLVGLATCASPFCKEEEFEGTICEDFDLSPELILGSGTNTLTIRNAKGQIIHENFANLEKVTKIRITESEITKIELGALCCTPNLTSISIINNRKFPKITRRTFQGCQHVKQITIDGAQIQIENGAFSDLNNLQTLTINATSVPRLEEDFLKGLESLRSLTIRHSKIRAILDSAFQPLKKLKYLDLQSNQIETIARNAFKGLVQLRFLNLSDNKLKNITWEEFTGLKSLRVLFMEYNEFNEVNVEKLVAGVPNLERIFLSYDKLTSENRKKIEEILQKLNITFIYINYPIE